MMLRWDCFPFFPFWVDSLKECKLSASPITKLFKYLPSHEAASRMSLQLLNPAFNINTKLGIPYTLFKIVFPLGVLQQWWDFNSPPFQTWLSQLMWLHTVEIWHTCACSSIMELLTSMREMIKDQLQLIKVKTMHENTWTYKYYQCIRAWFGDTLLVAVL